MSDPKQKVQPPVNTLMLLCAIEVHLITGLPRFHTQRTSVLLAKDVNFILNDSIYNNKHKCTCMIAFQKMKKGGGNTQW
jgi:hypothetical protein